LKKEDWILASIERHKKIEKERELSKISSFT
jgi:hypothetical protein